ncbi:MAG: N-acetyl-gamma-glutamyl-phosphate reductase [Chloroflexi bacterium]|nr:N-acetyl-gamma-glutamyl-phosphate reductase [Chloroflexota bacterium]
MIRVGIYGATGYAGYELLRILVRHPQAEIAFLASESHAGCQYSQVYPCPYEHALVSPEKTPLDRVDVVFLCTPHGASAVLGQRVLEAGAKCIDLSADFRLHDAAVYKQWYGEHPAPHLLDRAVYGLTEVYREQVARADLVANPGCYPTGPLLALYPILREGLLTERKIIIDAKSGVSGAGAKPSEKTHFVNVHDNFSAYNVGRSHRHLPEMEQELASFAQGPVRLVFVPHLLPVSRGILSTIYVSLDPTKAESDILSLWADAYAASPFVHVLRRGESATLAHAVNTNLCALSVLPAGVAGEFIIVTALDNLIKGASGQAVQNMNVMYGLDETMGLI